MINKYIIASLLRKYKLLLYQEQHGEIKLNYKNMILNLVELIV